VFKGLKAITFNVEECVDNNLTRWLSTVVANLPQRPKTALSTVRQNSFMSVCTGWSPSYL